MAFAYIVNQYKKYICTEYVETRGRRTYKHKQKYLLLKYVSKNIVKEKLCRACSEKCKQKCV